MLTQDIMLIHFVTSPAMSTLQVSKSTLQVSVFAELYVVPLLVVFMIVIFAE